MLRTHIFTFVMILFTLSKVNSLNIPFSDEELRTDDNLITNFVRVAPADSLIPNLKSEIWIRHDKRFLILDIQAEIDDKLKPGRFATEDDWIEADYFRIQIIIEDKDYYSYVFYVFPLGSRYDGIRNSDFQIDKNWDSSYYYESNIDTNFWKSIVYIPFKDLRFTSNPTHNWKIIITRYFDDKKEYYSFPFVRTNMGKDYFRKAADIRINENINKSINYFLRPYAIFKYDTLKKDASINENNIGIDFSFRPNYATNVKFSYNPDYSDVPPDDEDDIYNQKYAPTLAENRYFFIEDFNAFGIDNTRFYSRNILQPQYALKITGNSKAFSYGILSVKDKQTGFNDDDFYNVAAINPSFDAFNLQFTFLNRMNKGYYNNVFHVKPEIEIAYNKDIFFDFNLSTREEHNNTLNGYFCMAGMRLYEKDLSVKLITQQMSKNYYMDMGKTYQKDFYGWHLNLSHKKDFYSNIFRSLDTDITFSEEMDNSSNKLLERYLSFSTDLESFSNVTFSPDFYYQREYYANEYHNTQRLGLRLEWEALPYFEPKFSWNILESLIYSLGEVYSGYYYQYAVGGDISKYISYFISADNITYLDLQKTDQLDDDYWILNCDLDITFTNKIYLSGGLGFNNYEYRPFSDHWGMYSNLVWEYKPQSQIILGFRSAQDKIDNSLVKDYETLYLKINYNF